MVQLKFEAGFLAYLFISLVSIFAGVEAQADMLTSFMHSANNMISFSSATAWFEGSGIVSRIQFTADSRGGATVSVYASGLSPEFANAYHIHNFSVDSSGNCTSTGGHFNPLKAVPGQCDPKIPSRCEVGDLAGKHGKLQCGRNQSSLSKSYKDPSLELSESASGILYRSVVIHGAGTTRLACGTIIPDNSSD